MKDNINPLLLLGAADISENEYASKVQSRVRLGKRKNINSELLGSGTFRFGP